MSICSEQKSRIKYYIMEKIFFKQPSLVGSVAETFSISRQSVYKYIKELIADGIVEKRGNNDYFLISTADEVFKYKLKEKKLEEDTIYDETLARYTGKMNAKAKRIWEYAFTEMVNNAIDHSQADELIIYIGQNELYTWVNVIDDGLGIFQKIMTYYEYTTIDDAILSLFKGKLTTDKENHSGEGIFFTSQVMDMFAAISSNKVFSHINTMESLQDLTGAESNRKMKKYYGKKVTVIVMNLANITSRTLKEVFDMYSSVDGGFNTTKIPVKRISESGYPVSRSQAKRLYFGFEKFEKVILDFSDVEEIGQGFAHELFSVYAKRHPEIEFVIENANENVSQMIERVKNSNE